MTAAEHHRADAVIIPAALFDAFQDVLEDLVIAKRVAGRVAADDGTRVSLEELDDKHGWDGGDVSVAADALAAELGLS